MLDREVWVVIEVSPVTGFGRRPPVTNLNGGSPLLSGLLMLLMLLLSPRLSAGMPVADDIWVDDSSTTVALYFFWSKRCPHCLQARPYIESLPSSYSWIRVHSLELVDHPENRQRFFDMGRQVGMTPNSVPTFMWCGRSLVGFDTTQTTGRQLLEGLASCFHQRFDRLPAGVQVGGLEGDADLVVLPWFGSLDPQQFSLPVLAVVLGGLDAFNPCAFFVLLFLLSLLVNTRSRPRMLLVGGVFVVTSGLVYFAFMAAWLNLFQVLGGVRLVTLAAGALALVIGVLNAREYYQGHGGPSLGISDDNRQRLFRRMRGLLDTRRLPTLLFGALLLALAANSYELLCTLGLPMVFTRILTLEQLPAWHYYGYLALYNLVYVIPLVLIVLLFVLSMGRRKLTESEGRFLKLLSGHMMAGLGLLLLLAPDRLSQPLWAIALILLAVLSAVLIHRFRSSRQV